MTKASVVIVTYDSAKDIVACLTSLESQRRDVDFETVVVDNGSHDGTPEIVRKRFPRVHLVEQSNLGFGGGNNTGVQHAKGEVVVFLNPDAVAEPGFLRALVQAVGKRQVATAQVVLASDPALVNTAGHRLHFTGYGFVVGFRRTRLPPGPPIPTQGFSGAAFAMRRDDFIEMGGFDPDFFLYMEDTEFSWRLQRAGFRVMLAPAAVAIHDYGLEVFPKKIGHLETGRLLLLRKHLPWYLWLAYAPSLVVAEGLAWLRAAWLGVPGLKAKWRSVRSGWRRRIKRYGGLPRVRPHQFTSQAIPFGDLSRLRVVAVLGALPNLVFRLNTLSWMVRRGKRIRLP